MYHSTARRICLSLVTLALAADLATAKITSAYSPAGFTVSVNTTGAFTIGINQPAWQFAGNVGQPLSSVASASGTDTVGPYTELTFSYTVDGPRRGAIRAYS